MSDSLPIIIEPHKETHGKTRVAAYCRVSSTSDEQLNSYISQVDYYRKTCAADDKIIFVGIYGDAGISGTGTANRDGFTRMIDDCRKGLIDAIWTKSVSRFGRNTVDTLTFTRELRSLGIDVFFEKENIHTLEPAGEMLLTLMAAFAESESENMSENIKWGKRRRYEHGLVESITVNEMYGFRQKDSEITIVPEEAETVRRIYSEYLNGYGFAEIADHLNRDGIDTRRHTKWSHTVLSKMLSNEKYTGDCILQKTFIADPITHRCVVNTGQLDRYMIEDCYPAIVDRKTWRLAQMEYEHRRSIKANGSFGNEEYPFAGMLTCAVCGKPFHTSPSGGIGRVVHSLYRCVSRKDHTGVEVPGMTYIQPHKENYNYNPTPALAAYRENYSKKPVPRPYVCSDTRVKVARPPKAFVEAWNTLISHRQRYLLMLEANRDSDDELLAYHASELLALVQEGRRLKEFDYPIYRKTIDRIDVQPTGKLTFYFKAGIKITT